MNKEKKKEIKESSKSLVLDTILEVGSDSVTEMAKDTTTSVLGEILIDAGGSLIPGLSGAISGYKRARFENNIKQFTIELSTRIEEIREYLVGKSEEQKEQINRLLEYVMDHVIDEQQEQKIEFMVNGFVNLTKHEQISDDFVLTYYDLLKELRMVDLSVIKLMYSSNYFLTEGKKETYIDILERHGISYEQYESVRRNLQRLGLLTTKAELNLVNDLEEIASSVKGIINFLSKLTNSKNRSSLPKLKEPRLQSKENLQISKFGREFVEFFIDVDKVSEESPSPETDNA